MLQVGDNIIHKTFGKGTIMDIAVYDSTVYISVQFKNDKQGQLRNFTEDSIKPFLI